MADATTTEATENGAIYHETPPYQLLAGKIYAGITGLMVLLALLFCFIKGATTDGTFNLLGINLIISTVVIGFLMWWYKTGALAQDKGWFIILVASIIIFQCITADIYVFRHQITAEPIVTASPGTPRSSVTPVSIKPPSNITKVPNGTKSLSFKSSEAHNDVLFAKLPEGKRIREKKK